MATSSGKNWPKMFSKIFPLSMIKMILFVKKNPLIIGSMSLGPHHGLPLSVSQVYCIYPWSLILGCFFSRFLFVYDLHPYWTQTILPGWFLKNSPTVLSTKYFHIGWPKLPLSFVCEKKFSLICRKNNESHFPCYFTLVR